MVKTNEDKEKIAIKSKVIKIIDVEASKLAELIEVNTEGSLTETIQYLTTNDVAKILDMCFDETYNIMKKKITNKTSNL
jgi:hypothetical protein